jgi:hypothetical protein
VPGVGGPVPPGTATAPIEALPDADEPAETDADTSAERANDTGPAAETSAEPRYDAGPDAHPPALASNTHTAAGENTDRSGESPSTGSGPGGSDPDAQ